MTYRFYHDGSHGWIAVTKQELIDLGIADKITPYSFTGGKWVYLEEDCDVHTWIKAHQAIEPAWSPDFNHRYSGGRFVRSLARYEVA